MWSREQIRKWKKRFLMYQFELDLLFFSPPGVELSERSRRWCGSSRSSLHTRDSSANTVRMSRIFTHANWRRFQHGKCNRLSKRSEKRRLVALEKADERENAKEKHLLTRLTLGSYASRKFQNQLLTKSKSLKIYCAKCFSLVFILATNDPFNGMNWK